MDLGLRLPSAASFMMMSLPDQACTGSRQTSNRLVPVQCGQQNLNRLHVYRKCAVWDTRVTGLGVRVGPSEYRTFVFLDSRDGSSKHRILGPVTLMDVKEARARCLDVQSGGEKALQLVGATEAARARSGRARAAHPATLWAYMPSVTSSQSFTYFSSNSFGIGFRKLPISRNFSGSGKPTSARRSCGTRSKALALP